jgi:hypothetical protein
MAAKMLSFYNAMMPTIDVLNSISGYADISRSIIDITQAQKSIIEIPKDRRLLKELFRIGAQFRCRKLYPTSIRGMRIRIVYTIHTFGRDLVFTPHAPLVTPAPTAGAVSQHVVSSMVNG